MAPRPMEAPTPSRDILVEIDGKKVGVSVTRAYKPKNQGAQTYSRNQIPP